MTTAVASGRTAFVERTLYALNFSAFRARDHLREWFALAFNEWYAPLYARGRFQGSFATIFDLGMQLANPAIGWGELPAGQGLPETRYRRYQGFLRSLHDRPLMQRARGVWETAGRAERPGARLEAGWLLLEALIQDLGPGCPGAARFRSVHEGSAAWSPEESAHLDECPRCSRLESARKAGGEAWLSALDDSLADVVPPFVTVSKKGTIAVVAQQGTATLGELPLQIPAFDTARPYPAFWLPPDLEGTEVPHRVRLFMAHGACYRANVEEVLDDPVVEACLHGPDRPPADHQPPRLYTTVLEERTKSTLPGRIAGMTRIESKTDLDSLLDVVPSELALFLENETAGLQKLLEKPLIYKREREQDLVPKHRALVCFVVEVGVRGRGLGRAPAARESYVFAKRQAFDLIRDLREGLERLRNRADVEVDVAVFVLSAYSADAVVHRLFRLDQLPPRQSPDEALNRFDQMTQISALVPGFFNRVGWREEPEEMSTGSGAQEIIDPRLEQFLQRRPQRVAPYHAEYIVPIGSVNRLLEFVPPAVRELPLAANVRRRVMLIAVDPAREDPHRADEPAWSAAQARSLQEAAALLGRDLPDKGWDQLRREFCEMVLGASEGRTPRRLSLELV